MVQDSEYLETNFIAVPSIAKKDFLKTYETLAPMVVPRSSVQVAQDDEFTLFAVTTFKKTAAEFLQKCREQKWTPRQYKYVQGGQEEEKRELERIAKEERKVFHEALRLGRTGWSESVMVWAHVMALRVFVETVLRYGLPLEFVSALVKVSAIYASEQQPCRDTGSTDKINLTTIDKSQAGEEGQDLVGQVILLSWRKRFWAGQARQDQAGRCRIDV